MSFEDGDNQLVLRAKVSIESRLCDVGLGDDAIDADRGHTVPVKEFVGSAQNPLTGLGRRLVEPRPVRKPSACVFRRRRAFGHKSPHLFVACYRRFSYRPVCSTN